MKSIAKYLWISLLLMVCILSGISSRADDSIWMLPDKPENAELTNLLVTPQETILLRYRFWNGSTIENRTQIQLADRNGQVIHTWNLDVTGFVRVDAAGHIIINMSTHEQVDRVLVANANGQTLFEKDSDGGQSAWPSVHGSEILLATQPWAETLLFGEMVFLDADTGKVNGTFRKETSHSSGIGFILMGKDHRFILGDGATLIMRSYAAPNDPVWKIGNIGGKIDELRFLNPFICVVSYRGEGFRGKALLHMDTGNVLYRTVYHYKPFGTSRAADEPGFHLSMIALKNGDILMVRHARSRGNALLLRNESSDPAQPRYVPDHIEQVKLPFMSSVEPRSDTLIYLAVIRGQSISRLSGNRVRIQHMAFPTAEVE